MRNRVLAGALLAVQVVVGGEALPGSPGFVPTPERPVGWRGDGTAVYAGATPVTNWDAGRNVNLRWKTAMPALANSQPLVVAGTVFTTAEPRFLIACDLKTGAVLWQADVDPVELQGASTDVVSKAKQLYPLFAQVRQLQLETGLNGLRKVPAERGIPAWKRLREVLNAMRDVGFPGLDVTAPDDAEIERESADFEHSSINGHVKRPFGWFEGKYGFRVCETWPHDGGFTLPAPASDGTRVYVAMGQGQVAAYDLNGKRVWGRFHAKTPKGGGCVFYPSPLLVDGMLIVQHDFMLRAFNCADGTTAWEIPHDGPGNGYTMGTGHVLRPDGRTALLVTATGPIVRLRDGKEVGRTGIANCGSEWGGVSVVGDGKDTVYLFPGNNGGGDAVALQVTLAGDAATVVERWKAPHKNRSITPVLFEGLLYHSNDDKAMVVRDAATGEIVRPLELATRWPSPAIAGRHLFVALGDGSVQIATIGRDAARVGISRLGEAGNKNPGGICEAAPTFAGDAVILRTHGFLYCFGAP